MYFGGKVKPLNDKIKIEVSVNEYGFGDSSAGVEKGIVIEVPDKLAYLGFHSFAFENSLVNKESLSLILDYYNALTGKLVFWETLQDRGRRFKENDKEYVFLNMTDIIAYSNDININVQPVDQTGSAGSFNLS